MDDSDLRDLKAALSTLESAQSLPRSFRFRALRHALKLAVRYAGLTEDPAVWRILGERELRRHEKFSRMAADKKPGAENEFIRRLKVEDSFTRAVAWLGKAGSSGDSAALTSLGHLYLGSYSGLNEKFARPSKALHYFRKALAAGSAEALYDVFHVLASDRWFDMGLPYLRQACRRGHVPAMVALAELTGKGELLPKDDREVMRLLEDASEFYAQQNLDDVYLKARIDFLHGACLWTGAGVKADKEIGLMLVQRAAPLNPDAAKWLEQHEQTPEDTSLLSPMRFFSVAYKAKGRKARLDKTEEEILKPLDALSGLENVKDHVARLVQLGKAQALRQLNGLPTVPLSLHMAFLGAPGTGKTSAARLIGQVLADAGLLSKGHVVETDRSGLVGQYIGHTETMTRAKLEKAVGGVLFIDEAYALGNKDSARDYGNDAIELILKFMEDKRGDLAVIVAGYDEPMEIFFNSNPGIRSRFGHVLRFGNLAASDAGRLFREMCAANKYKLSAEVEAEIDRHFAKSVRQGELHNANGRGVRVLFEDMVAKQARRVVRNQLHAKTDLVTVLMEDLPWDTGRERLHVVKD